MYFSFKADLSGIKWCKFKTSDNVYSVEPLGDPVLEAFTRCIHADVLCVWQRAKRTQATLFCLFVYVPRKTNEGCRFDDCLSKRIVMACLPLLIR